jgi:hypothetical protein
MMSTTVACGPGSSSDTQDPLRTVGDSINGQPVTSGTIRGVDDESVVRRVSVVVIDPLEQEETFRELAARLGSSIEVGVDRLPATEGQACDEAKLRNEAVGFMRAVDRLDHLIIYAILCV